MGKNIELAVDFNYLKELFIKYNTASDLLWDNHQEQNTGNKFGIRDLSIIPYMTTIGFTIELGLKSLCFKNNNKWPEGHLFKPIFDLLAKENQTNINNEAYNFDEKLFAQKKKDFNRLLEENSDTFVKWRYYFDKPSQPKAQGEALIGGNYAFLLALKYGIKEEILRTSI